MSAIAAGTAAVVVVYHLTRDIGPTLQALQRTVEHVLLIDNSERGHPGLDALAARCGADFLHAGNHGGLAGAYNRAMALLPLRYPRTQQLVFLDEDSDPATLAALLADPATRQALARDGTGAVAPAYRDRATGLRGRYIRLGRWRLSFNPREFTGLRPVAFVINSMSVWRVPALQRIGPFNEALAVDHVDTEYCLRARQRGFALYVNGSFEFAHSIGERRKYRVLGRELQAGGHPPERRYTIARNTVWLARDWFWREPAFVVLCLARLGYEALGILMAEDGTRPKLSALARGTAAGLLTRQRPA